MSSIPPDEATLPSALAQAWRADQASTAELRRGYARFMAHQGTAARTPLFARWLVGGLVIGLGLAQAAGAVSARWLGAHEVLTPPPAPVHVAAVPRETTAHPAPVVSAWVTPVAPSAQPLNPQPSVPRRSSKPPAEPYVQEQWQHAATALRENDFVRAEQALLEVERHADGAERDAAQLARAQLLSTNGRTAEALVLALNLQAHAQAPLLREKARALVARLSKNAGQDRSKQPAAAVNQP